MGFTFERYASRGSGDVDVDVARMAPPRYPRPRTVGRQISTGHGAECCTREAVLPRRIVAVRPRLPAAMEMRPAECCSAARMISVAGDPLRTSW